MNRSISLAVVLGQATLSRLSTVRVSTELRPLHASLAKSHAALDAAVARTRGAAALHRDSLVAAQEARVALQESTQDLAEVLVRIDPASRLRPFEPFGGFSPARLGRGSRAAAAKLVEDLVLEISKHKVRKEVRVAAAVCKQRATALRGAHDVLVARYAELVQAREKRDALLAEFSATFEAMRALAKRVWRSNTGTYDAVFGPLQRALLENARQNKKGASTPEPGGEQPVAPPPQPVAPPPVTPAEHGGPQG